MCGLAASSLSIIIATKNRPADLEKAIQSVLVQTRLPNELVLVDQSPERLDDGVRLQSLRKAHYFSTMVWLIRANL